MIPDSSVLVAGYVNSHPAFGRVQDPLKEVRDAGRLAAHTIAEFFAIVTGPTYSVQAADTNAYIEQFCKRDPVGPSAGYPAAIAEIGRAGITGGAVYDALIAVSVRDAGEQLITLDRRAAGTYRAIGVEHRLLNS